jgi:D-sorbitol dehydrogenase (acceptor)
MADAGRLSGKHAILTGAAGGIGLAVAQAYLAEGAHCTIADLGAHPSEGVRELLQHYPAAAAYVETDVTQPASVARLVAQASGPFGPVDVLFNNAAIFEMAPLLESDEASYTRIFDVNVKGMFFVMQAVLRQMVDNKVRGSIVNMSSQAGRRGEALVSHYCASKAAVISYTQSAALAMAPLGIRVNGIAPGVVDTPMWKHVDAQFARYEGLALGEKKIAVGKAVPLGRMGTPDDMTGAAVFLASDDSRYITAQTLNVDGGNWMS